MVATPFTCDVHKASSSIKAVMVLSDDTLVGTPNIALALEGSGSLDRLRSILHELFAQELQIVHSLPQAEGTDVFAHTQVKQSSTLFCLLMGMAQI